MLRGPLVLALALLAGCASSAGPEPAPPIRESNPTAGYSDRAYRAHLSLSVTGDSSATIDQDMPVRIVEILGDQVPDQAHFFSIQPDEPVILEDGRLIRFSADIAPGTYEGPGRTYTLSGEGGVEIEGAQSLGSGAYVELIRRDPPVQARYDVFGEPCTVEIADNYGTGVVDCPRLLDADGNAVALSWSWRLASAEEA